MRSIASIAALLLIGTAWAGELTPPPTIQQTPVPVQVLPAGPVATIETSLGTITLVLDAAHAPVTVANFERYAREGHFDGTVFYRVEPGFVIQAGSYNADGSFKGGLHADIPLEANNGLHNQRGAIAMARGDDPASADAEFFIDLADNTGSLDPAPGDTANKTGYAVFGLVVDGMSVVDAIAGVPLGGKGPFPPTSTPVTPVVIVKVTISGA